MTTIAFVFASSIIFASGQCNISIADLSADEADDLKFYTAIFYRELNYILRNQVPDLRSRESTQRIEAALKKLPTFAGTVYRGSNSRVFGRAIDTVRVGDILSDKSFLSTTASIKVFQTTGFWREVGFVIQSKTGRNISRYSSKPTEDEVLFLPNTKFRVNKIEPTKKLTHTTQLFYLSEL